MSTPLPQVMMDIGLAVENGGSPFEIFGTNRKIAYKDPRCEFLK